MVHNQATPLAPVVHMDGVVDGGVDLVDLGTDLSHRLCHVIIDETNGANSLGAPEKGNQFVRITP